MKTRPHRRFRRKYEDTITTMDRSAVRIFALLFFFPGVVFSQQDISSSSNEGIELPDAPSAIAAPKQSPSTGMPPGYFVPGRPMDVSDKFKYYVEPAFGPRGLLINALGAGIRMANPPQSYPREWHSGAEAYGRFYGDQFARRGAQSLAQFSTSVLLHEDARYRRSQSTFFPSRLAHALAFTLVDRTDGGHSTIAISNFAGAAAGGFIGNMYLPAGFDDLTHAGQRSVIGLGGIAGRNILQEFAPELGKALARIHIHPHGVSTPPVWWNGDK